MKFLVYCQSVGFFLCGRLVMFVSQADYNELALDYELYGENAEFFEPPAKFRCVTHPEIVIAQQEAALDYELYGGPPSIPPAVLPNCRKTILGRTPLYVKYPSIVPSIDDFLKLHGYGAHDKRRTLSYYSSGLSLSDMRRFLLKEIPQLTKDGVVLSLSTIHHLLVAPRKNSSSAHKYLGLIDAKVSTKRADLTEFNPDAHYAAAELNYVAEMAKMFEDEVLLMSCDDKNKLTLGLPAVDRRNANKKFYPRNDTPNYPDHDYPIGEKAKLTPAGYMVLMSKKPRSRSCEKRPILFDGNRRTRSSSPPPLHRKFKSKDKHNRLHVKWPRSGSLTIYLKGDKFHKSTSQMHANQLLEVLEPETNCHRSVVSMCVDGGPDWSTKSEVNLTNYGRVWRDLNLDCFILISYAPGHSKFNPIEHAWAPVNTWFVGSIVPSSISFETPTGTETKKLGDENGLFDNAIYTNAIEAMIKYFDGRSFDGFHVSGRPVPLNDDWKTYTDHEEIHEIFTKCRKRDLNTDSMVELRYLSKHCIRKKYSFLFKKDNCDICRARGPIKATAFMSLLEKMGGSIPDPRFDFTGKRYETFGERCFQAMTRIQRPMIPDAHLPSVNGQSKRYKRVVCEKGCTFYALTDAEAIRHDKNFHS